MTDHNNLYNILNKLNSLTPSAANSPVTKSKQKNLLESTMSEVIKEKYMGFNKTEKAIAKNPNVKDPGAVAASIGRKKYGKAAFQKAAAAGKKMGESEMEEGNEFSGELAKARAQHKDEFNVDGKTYPVKENGLQRYTGIKKYGKKGFEALQKAGRDGASEEEKGRIKDRYLQNEKQLDEIRYMASGYDQEHTTPARVKEVAPPGAKAERMVKHIKKGYARNGKLTPKEKSIAYATAWKAHNAGKVEEAVQALSVLSRYGMSLEQITEGWDDMLKDVEKKRREEKGTGKFDKKKDATTGGTIYTRKYDPKSGESEESGKDSEGNATQKRGRGRPKKSTFESHKVINRLVDDVFEDIMGEGDEEQLSYEQEQLKTHIGANMYKQLANTMKTNEDFNDNLFDVLYDYYIDEMPYGVAKARTGDPTQWLHDKLQRVFPALDEGSIQSGVWTATPPKPGNPNVPAPMDPEGVPAQRVSKSYPAPQKTAPTAPAAPASAPMGTIKGGVWTADAPKPGEKGVPVPVPVDESLNSILKLAGMQVNESKAKVQIKEGAILNRPDNTMAGAVTRTDPTRVQVAPNVQKSVIDYNKKIADVDAKNDTWRQDTNPVASEFGKSVGNFVGSAVAAPKAAWSAAKQAYNQAVEPMAKPEPPVDVIPDPKKGSSNPKESAMTDEETPVKENSLTAMLKLAGMKVAESKADEKADNDYDNDGKVKTGKEEYLGSKIAAARKAGKLKEGKCSDCGKDPCVCKEEKCMECGMYESKCSCTKQVDECMSPMANGMEDQEGTMNIDTSMDSKGHKSVTITADGNSALELMQMLKLAGVNGGEIPQEEPEGVMVIATPDEEELEEDSRYEANTTPEEHAYPVQKLTKGGDGDVAGREKRMHPDKPTWKNGDNALAETVSLKMMREYEGIKIKK